MSTHLWIRPLWSFSINVGENLFTMFYLWYYKPWKKSKIYPTITWLVIQRNRRPIGKRIMVLILFGSSVLKYNHFHRQFIIKFRCLTGITGIGTKGKVIYWYSFLLKLES